MNYKQKLYMVGLGAVDFGGGYHHRAGYRTGHRGTKWRV